VIRSYTIGIGDFSVEPIENRVGAWLQDDWAASRKLTLNLGVRYDMSTGMFAEDVVVQPWLNGHRHADKNNVAPRLGFTYAVDSRTVVRGGFGQYFGDNGFSQAHWTNLWAGQVHPVLAERRPSRFREQSVQRSSADARARPGCCRRRASISAQSRRASPRRHRRCRIAISRRLACSGSLAM
jgi:hypothetical protein